MTVRTAELLVAVIAAFCSIGLMLKSAELNIGWVPERGPGSGMWPFWLSFGMLLASLATIYRWFRGITPESRSSELYISRETAVSVGISAAMLLFLLAATHVVGIYVSMMFFLLCYLRLIGRHTWLLTSILMIGIPVFVFCLFEWALKIPLPKAFTEPLFYPIYDLMYS